MTVWACIAAAIFALGATSSIRAAATNDELGGRITMIAPAGAGGGWDTFAREQQQASRIHGITTNAQVVNIPGAGGTIGLAAFANMDGEANTIMATGSAMVGGIELNNSPTTLADVNLLARVAQDFPIIIVSDDSPYQDLSDLLEAQKEKPDVWTGGSVGSTDHFLVAATAMALDIPVSDLTYIPRSGSGEAIQTISSHTAQAAVVGYNEVEDQITAGRVRALAVASPERLPGIDVPTMREEGYDVVLENWRGWLAPPGITESQKAALLEVVTEIRESEEWQDALTRNKWTDAFLTGNELEEFVTFDSERTADLVKELGL